jgi:polar amino acid transport system permease protein
MRLGGTPGAPGGFSLPRLASVGPGLGLVFALIAGVLVGVPLARWSGAISATGTLGTMAKWAPLIFSGFLLNLLVSVLSMALGTALGVGLGLAQVSLWSAVRRAAWLVTQFFRNAPWLVLLFYAMLILPFEVQVFGQRVPLPGLAQIRHRPVVCR